MTKIAIVELNLDNLLELLNRNMPSSAKKIPSTPHYVKVLFDEETEILTIAINHPSLPDNIPGEKYPTLYVL